MAKIMVFIDGTWLYYNIPRLGETYGKEEFRVDFGELPRVLADEIGRFLATTEPDLVRTYLFGSYAYNYDLQDEEAATRRQDFFDMLKEEYQYEVDIYPIDFKGRRLRRADRDLDDPFEPKEKCVDIALATAMLYLAAVPNAYDIGVAVIGDRDYTPMLQHLRRLGKRVAIASIKDSCPPEFADPRDEARVRDYDIIWLDDLLDRLELKYEPYQAQCESPHHKGDRSFWTTFRPRKGQKLYCDDCRQRFQEEKQEAERELVGSGISRPNRRFEPRLSGTIKSIKSDQGYGFITTGDNIDYFFHLTDLRGLEFENLRQGQSVRFEVKKPPTDDKAGAAQNVRPNGGHPVNRFPSGN